MLSSRAIIIVDNDPDDLYLLSYSFHQIGSDVEVLLLNSGEELISYLSKNKHAVQPSLVVLDYNMPVLNGGETLRRMKSNPSLAQIPVLVYSTSITHAMKKELASFGVLNCLEKAQDCTKLLEHARYFQQLAQSKEVLQVH